MTPDPRPAGRLAPLSKPSDNHLRVLRCRAVVERGSWLLANDEGLYQAGAQFDQIDCVAHAGAGADKFNSEEMSAEF